MTERSGARPLLKLSSRTVSARSVSVSGKRTFEAREHAAPNSWTSNTLLAETERSRQRPPTWGHLLSAGKFPLARECVVADAVVFEPVSEHNFPARREKYREIRLIAGLALPSVRTVAAPYSPSGRSP